MNRLEAEKVLNNLELDIEKARHMAEKIIEEYGFDCTEPSSLDDSILAYNRQSIGIDLGILTDYIDNIRTGYDSISREIMGAQMQ